MRYIDLVIVWALHIFYAKTFIHITAPWRWNTVHRLIHSNKIQIHFSNDAKSVAKRRKQGRDGVIEATHRRKKIYIGKTCSCCFDTLTHQLKRPQTDEWDAEVSNSTTMEMLKRIERTRERNDVCVYAARFLVLFISFPLCARSIFFSIAVVAAALFRSLSLSIHVVWMNVVCVLHVKSIRRK